MLVRALHRTAKSDLGSVSHPRLAIEGQRYRRGTNFAMAAGTVRLSRIGGTKCVDFPFHFAMAAIAAVIVSASIPVR
jgi:hypothetical protein